MKKSKFFRIIPIALLLALLITAAPAAPAQAYSMTLSTSSAQVGDSVVVTLYGFPYSADPSVAPSVVLYFSNQTATTGQLIGTNVTVYKTLVIQQLLVVTPTVTVTVPTQITAAVPVTDGTYYLYACIISSTSPNTIYAVGTLTVTGSSAGTISLDPDEGVMDDEIEITGEDFAASTDIIIEFDGDEVDIDGDNQTDSSGDFVSYILVPETAYGEYDITVTVGSSAATATFTVLPEISLFPTSGEKGDLVTVNGNGFGNRSDLTVWFNNSQIATGLTYRDGTIDPAITFTVPDLPAGSYRVDVEDEDENIEASAYFTITTPSTPPEETPETEIPAVTGSLSPASTGPVGMDIFLTGSGFTPGATVLVKFDGANVATGTATAQGVFAALFKVPAGASGARTITATDGTNTLEMTFTVETTPPPTPSALLPAAGADLKTPITFDWGDVTDASLPVTYTLQVATDINFGTSSIKIEKENLSASTYTLTDAEALVLSGQQVPYYWRVSATDAAANTGAWSNVRQFTVSPPFSLPDWAIYTIIGVGGLLLFGIGFFVGRRTAFFF